MIRRSLSLFYSQLPLLEGEERLQLGRYLEFQQRHQVRLCADTAAIIPAAARIFGRQLGGAPAEQAQLDALPPAEPLFRELRTAGKEFVDQGGQISDWLVVCRALRKSVLSLLSVQKDQQDPEAQSSILLGLGLFVDLMTMSVSQSLFDADEPFRLAFDAAPTGLIIVDPQTRIRFVNAEAERLFGYRREELTGQPIEILIPHRFRKMHKEHGAAYTQNPVERIMGAGRDLFGLRKDGAEFPVEIGLNPSRGGRHRSVLAVVVDVSERKQAQAELVSKMWELQRSNEDLEQFAYVASHDLQEPLRMVVSYSTLLAERYSGQLDAKADKFIRYAVEGAMRMQQLVADLLAYSRVGSQKVPPRPVNLQTVLDETLAGMRSAIEESGATIQMEPLPVVSADPIQMAQLFQNLIGNALKFRSEKPPQIHITAQRAEGKWMFSVNDNGIGFEQEHSERIFQMFQRLHERGKYQGSGIGLTIAKKIVEQHRGRIWAESRPGQGSTFFFSLPDVPAEAP